jgi:ABC-type polysaccharide/polyol phosphate export permease
MWSAFSRGTSMGMESIMNKSGLVSQIYLPREVLVLSGVLTSFLMMIFEFMVFFVFMIVFQVMPAITIVLLAPMLILLFLFTLGISFGLSSLYIYYRDLRAIWGVVLQAGFFLGTIIYTIDIFPENVRPLISLNPFVPLLEISRNATIYNKWPSTDSGLLYLLLIILIVNIGGYAIFKKLDKRLVEEL